MRINVELSFLFDELEHRFDEVLKLPHKYFIRRGTRIVPS